MRCLCDYILLLICYWKTIIKCDNIVFEFLSRSNLLYNFVLLNPNDHNEPEIYVTKHVVNNNETYTISRLVKFQKIQNCRSKAQCIFWNSRYILYVFLIFRSLFINRELILLIFCTCTLKECSISSFMVMGFHAAFLAF